MAADGMTISWLGSVSGSNGAESSAAIGTSGRALAAPDDRILIEQAQTGDREAFETLVHRYDRDVLRIALNILRKPEDARDVYQEAFLKIYKNLSRFRFECSFYTWLYRIVTNVCLDHLRRRSSRPEDQSPDPALHSRWRGRERGFLRPATAAGRGVESGTAPDGIGNRPADLRGARAADAA